MATSEDDLEDDALDDALEEDRDEDEDEDADEDAEADEYLARADLLEQLIHDHRALRGLLEQMDQQVDEDPEGTRVLLPEVRFLLVPHARAEERVLYPALEAVEETAELAHVAREEHALVEHVLDQMLSARVVDEAWKAKLKVLTELLDQHVDDEEERIFPEARRVFGAERLAELYLQFLTVKQREEERLGGGPRDELELQLE